MAKRASLFSPKADPGPAATGGDQAPAVVPVAASVPVRGAARAPSRVGKRVLSLYLDPLAWKQLRQLALQQETTTQALGEEAINLLFAKHGLNRSA